MKPHLCLLISLLNLSFIAAQTKSTKNVDRIEPMVLLGYVDFREANILVMHQTAIENLTYWDITSSDKKMRVQASAKKINDQYLTKFKLGPLEPGATYEYKLSGFLGLTDKSVQVYKVKTPPLWKWRNSPPDFSIAIGSCAYFNQSAYDRPGPPYGDTSFQIFEKIAEKNPDLMLWLGDNLYLRESDWGSEMGINERYIHTRKQDGLRKLLSTCPNLSIWDDHEFGPNDANGSFYNKELTREAFCNFWANPGCGIHQMGGINYAFDYNDVHFLMLDNRYHRTPDFCDSCLDESVLGKDQLQWLKMNLLTLPKSEFKIIGLGGQFLNSAKVFENYSNYEWEKNEIIQFIHKHQISNVIFISGDRHFSELSLLKKAGKPSIYDFTVSPLTSGVYANVDEKNKFRVESTLYREGRNFGMIQFVGKEKNRSLRFILYDKEGNEVYQKQFQME